MVFKEDLDLDPGFNVSWGDEVEEKTGMILLGELFKSDLSYTLRNNTFNQCKITLKIIENKKIRKKIF